MKKLTTKKKYPEFTILVINKGTDNMKLSKFLGHLDKWLTKQESKQLALQRKKEIEFLQTPEGQKQTGERIDEIFKPLNTLIQKKVKKS